MPCTIRSWGRCSGLLGFALGCCLLATRARAQSCGPADDDDGGMICMGEDDAGEPTAEPDDDGGPGTQRDAGGAGGMSGGAGFGGAGSGMDGGVVLDRDQCSCSTTIDDPKQGRIHVCTQGETRAACNDFTCSRGRVAPDTACSQSNIRLCCVMSTRHLVSVLYDDCTHPNCQAGFTQQCTDFAGTLHAGDCDSLVRGDDANDSGGDGGCAVTSSPASSDLAGMALGVLGLLLARRRRAYGC